MKILVLTQWCYPEPELKGVAFARELHECGHEVEILTGYPNYPGGKLYPGFRIRLYRRDVIDGIVVHRVPLYPSHDNSALHRIANYISFAISAAVIGPFVVKKPDVMFVYHPPATVGLPALVMKWLRRIPFVYDVNDLWPDTLVATGMLNSKLALRAVGFWCRLVYSQAKRVTVLSPGFVRMLVARGVPREKIRMVYNWCDDSLIGERGPDHQLRRELGFDGHFTIVFAGTMGKAQALDAVLDAASLVQQRRPRVQFVFIGDGIELPRLQQRAADERLSNVKFMPRRPMAEIGALLSVADVLLVHLKDDPLFQITIPSKTQAYLASGRPILMAVSGDAAALVTEASAGIGCAPENAGEIAAAVEKLNNMPTADLDKMGRNGREFYRKNLTLRAGAERLDGIIRSALLGGPERPAFDLEANTREFIAPSK